MMHHTAFASHSPCGDALLEADTSRLLRLAAEVLGHTVWHGTPSSFSFFLFFLIAPRPPARQAKRWQEGRPTSRAPRPCAWQEGRPSVE